MTHTALPLFRWILPRISTLCFLFFALQPCFSAEASSSSLEQRLVTQHQIFEEFSEHSTRGDGGGLAEAPSLAEIAGDDLSNKHLKARLSEIPQDDFPEEEKLSHELLLRVLNQRIVDFESRDFEMPFGVATPLYRSLAELPISSSFQTVADFDRYADQLKKIPQVLGDQVAILKLGIADGLTSPRLLVADIPKECLEIITTNPFIAPTRDIPSAISMVQGRRITKKLTTIVNTDVLPAYRAYASFMQETYLPSARDSIGLIGLPDGLQRYQRKIHEETTTDLTPVQIHELGLQEVARLNGQLAQIAARAGYADLSSYRIAINADPRYIPTSTSQIVEDFRRYVEKMEPRLPELFSQYPRSKLIVEPDSVINAGFGTHHVDGSADGTQPGKVVVAVANFSKRRLISDETQAYHEGLPGHELQMSIQARLKGLPAFRAALRNTAYVEGWAVYAESLGKEIGFFQEPASDYGRLNLELMRAVRLVVDTGINADGWSRDQAVAYFRSTGSADEPTIQSEVDRYIAWPAQSLGYKIGQIKILQLRERARQKLGVRFDIKAFHQRVLEEGSLPLDILEKRVDDWIDHQASDLASDMSNPRADSRQTESYPKLLDRLPKDATKQKAG